MLKNIQHAAVPTITTFSHFYYVGNFHSKFDLPITNRNRYPKIVDDSTFQFRLQFLLEEIQELLQSHRDKDLAGITDALVDLVYVALGTAHLYGIPFDEAFHEVQKANMKKVRASHYTDPRSKRKSSLDVVKPDNWVAPNITRVLEDYVKNVVEGDNEI